MRPTVAEIDTGALVRNYRLLEARVRAAAGAPVGLVAVVKADAYGHGVELCGRALAGAGAGWLGVTSVEEASALLGALGGLQRPRVLVMSGFFRGEEESVLRMEVTPQVWEAWHFQLLDEAARRVGSRHVPVHLEMDTGMGRQGVLPGAALAALLAGLARESPVWVEGVMTHFSSPEDARRTRGQLELFRAALQQAWAAGVRPRWVHAGNSTNALGGDALGVLEELAREIGAELLVRPGLALYGIEAASEKGPGSQKREAGGRAAEEALSANGCAGLKAVMRWRTEVVSVREVPAGAPVGYGATFRAPRGGARLALLPVGYADGLRRKLSNCGAVLVRGHRAPIVGRVSMDQTVVDVSSLPDVAVGDEAVLLGRQGEEEIQAWEMAGWFEGITYEAVCGVGARVRRVPVG